MKKKLGIMLVLCCMLLVSCGTNQATDVEENGVGEEAKQQAVEFIDTLRTNEFLPGSILDTFEDPIIEQTKESEEGDVDGFFYYWRLKEENSDDVIHKIEANYDDDNELIYYHYKNYSYEIPKKDQSISRADAASLARDFVRAFVDEDKEFTLENDPNKQYESLYDPGHVETWTFTDDDETHYIVIDLDMGCVVLYS